MQELILEKPSIARRMHMSRFSVFFKDEQFIPSKRSELYGRTDFLANCGGLLGLFMGVSLLSIVEVIYYFTLRLCCTLRMQRSTPKRNRVAAAGDTDLATIDRVDERKAHGN